MTDISAATPRIQYLDGLRGAAAAYVVLHHVFQFANSLGAQRVSPVWFKPASVFKYGNFGVVVFIVLSGYCLTLPVTASESLELRGGLRGFAVRRARRILPAYYGAVLASVLLIAAIPMLRETSGTGWDLTLPSLTVGAMLSHLLVVHNLFTQWSVKLDPPLWSVGLEFQIYFIFALALLPVWRRFGAMWAAVTTIAFVFVAFAAGLAAASPWMIAMFGLGSAAAAVGARPARVRRALNWDILALALTASVPIATFAVGRSPIHGAAASMLPESWVGLTTAVCLIALAEHARSGRVSLPARVLGSRLGVFAGARSYSLYLIHFPVLAVVALAANSVTSMSAPAWFFVLSVAALPAVMAATELLYVSLERPFLNSSSRPVPQPIPEGVVYEPA